MKKFINFVVSIIAIFSICATAYAANSTITKELTYKDIKISLNGVQLNVDHEPFIIEGTTYLPVRDICEALNLTVEWDSSTNTVVVTQNDTGVGVKIYITPTGKRYHYDNNCNGGTYYESTLDEAITKGLTPCNKCVLKDAA